jgi:hypothetical protein
MGNGEWGVSSEESVVNKNMIISILYLYPSNGIPYKTLRNLCVLLSLR